MNRTVEEVDAHFASVIAASLKRKAQPSASARSSPSRCTLDEADDDMPSLLPPGVCNCDAKDDNDPPVEASIAFRAGRRGQGTSLLSNANQVASRVLPSTMKEHADWLLTWPSPLIPLLPVILDRILPPSYPNRLGCTKY